MQVTGEKTPNSAFKHDQKKAYRQIILGVAFALFVPCLLYGIAYFFMCKSNKECGAESWMLMITCFASFLWGLGEIVRGVFRLIMIKWRSQS